MPCRVSPQIDLCVHTRSMPTPCIPRTELRQRDRRNDAIRIPVVSNCLETREAQRRPWYKTLRHKRQEWICPEQLLIPEAWQKCYATVPVAPHWRHNDRCWEDRKEQRELSGQLLVTLRHVGWLHDPDHCSCDLLTLLDVFQSRPMRRNKFFHVTDMDEQK